MDTSVFDERAPDWDTPERRERAMRVSQLLRDEVHLDRSMRVIEIGAGTGLLGLQLAPDVGLMMLTDPSSGMLEATRRKLESESGQASNVAVAAYELGGALPGGALFDLAIALLVLHHVRDTSEALLSIRGLLGPGGRIALLDLEAEDGSFHAGDATGVQHDGFDRSEIARLAERAGFTDVTARSAEGIEKNGRAYPLFLLTGRRL